MDVADRPSAQAEAARLEEARLAAVEERVEADLACGRHGELVGELETLTRAHPLRERLWSQRMIALYRASRQAEALRAYQELRRMLAEELGIEPSHEVRRLEAAVLRQDRGARPAARCRRGADGRRAGPYLHTATSGDGGRPHSVCRPRGGTGSVRDALGAAEPEYRDVGSDRRRTRRRQDTPYRGVDGGSAAAPDAGLRRSLLRDAGSSALRRLRRDAGERPGAGP